MHKYNFKNIIKCNCLHVRKWICGLLATQLILLPNYSFAQINPDITVQQMNNSFGVSAFDLTNYNLALNLNFGNKHPDTTYGALTAIYRGLVQAFGPAYYYEIQSNTLNSPARYAETQNVIRSLQAIEQNQWYMNQNLISSDSYLSGINSKLATQNSLLYDYNHVNDSSFSIGTTSRNTAVNTSNIYNELNNINWIDIPISSINASTSTNNAFNQTYISSAGLVGTDVYIRIDLQNNPSYNSILKFVLPIIPYTSSSQFTLADVYIMNSVNTGWAYIASPNTKLVGNTNNNASTVYFDGFIRSYAGANISNKILLHIHSNQSIYYLYNNRNSASTSYITTDKTDYHTVYDTYLLEQIKDKNFTADISGDVTVDTSDIVDAINNLSLQDNDVKLNININNNTGSDGTNVINRLQNFFNTGTSISDFFDNVDDAESGWFTQTNSDLINTLSGGYVNLYE